MGWNEFAFAFAAFFLTHSIPIRPPLRPWAVARLGHAGFGIAYSALSLAVLAWLIAAAGRAPYVPLWDWAPWQNHVVLAVMLPVCVILSLAIARPNPFSFGGAQNDRFDPARPGIVRLTRHPLLLALGIWSAAHILPNGDLAHVILFGTFAGFAMLGGRLVDRRRQREMGQRWHDLRAALSECPASLSLTADTVLRLAAGLMLYAGLIWLHPLVIGVDPLV
ncbi:NnrU family protein [Rhodobacter veldkampii DSM 11550]|uniref:NnrU family protein n=2 Tax=Paracoccaceae TaxID=31989 RepID=A0A2T4J646_9RHOB|nr:MULTISPECIES: NnrU family protein [Paracoccaceae]MBK5945733.1 NnrU family protein [Phaeovulum veldkampii DSM 11550]PTE13369.1 NnrU family protein [Phaeovulum veldkampii DSM 11550]TDQ56910.1 putative membrane protein [Phaeovulum veldkampii DSM 11550]TDX26903.1 putative membrane protein [Rhodovulum visakhapatnamense]